MSGSRKVYQPYDNIEQQIPETKPSTQPKTVKRKVVVQLTKFEKMLYIGLITIIALISIYMLSLKWMRMILEENCRFRYKNRKAI